MTSCSTTNCAHFDFVEQMWVSRLINGWLNDCLQLIVDLGRFGMGTNLRQSWLSLWPLGVCAFCPSMCTFVGSKNLFCVRFLAVWCTIAWEVHSDWCKAHVIHNSLFDWIWSWMHKYTDQKKHSQLCKTSLLNMQTSPLICIPSTHCSCELTFVAQMENIISVFTCVYNTHCHFLFWQTIQYYYCITIQ